MKRELDSHAMDEQRALRMWCVFMWGLHGKHCVAQLIRMYKSLSVILVGRVGEQLKCGSDGGLWMGLQASD